MVGRSGTNSNGCSPADHRPTRSCRCSAPEPWPRPATTDCCTYRLLRSVTAQSVTCCSNHPEGNGREPMDLSTLLGESSRSPSSSSEGGRASLKCLLGRRHSDSPTDAVCWRRASTQLAPEMKPCRLRWRTYTGRDLSRWSPVGCLRCRLNRTLQKCAQRGGGVDALDDLQRFFELKVYGGAEPEAIRLSESEVHRTRSPDLFIVAASGIAAGRTATTR